MNLLFRCDIFGERILRFSFVELHDGVLFHLSKRILGGFRHKAVDLDYWLNVLCEVRYVYGLVLDLLGGLVFSDEHLFSARLNAEVKVSEDAGIVEIFRNWVG